MAPAYYYSLANLIGKLGMSRTVSRPTLLPSLEHLQVAVTGLELIYCSFHNLSSLYVHTVLSLYISSHLFLLLWILRAMLVYTEGAAVVRAFA